MTLDYDNLWRNSLGQLFGDRRRAQRHEIQIRANGKGEEVLVFREGCWRKSNHLQIWNTGLEEALRIGDELIERIAGLTNGYSFAYLKELCFGVSQMVSLSRHSGWTSNASAKSQAAGTNVYEECKDTAFASNVKMAGKKKRKTKRIAQLAPQTR